MERLTERELEDGWIVYGRTKYTHETTRFNSSVMRKIIEKLKEYEDLEEQGKLLKLPCEVGQRVYMLYRLCEDAAWEIEEHKIMLEDLGNIGKTVFLTWEEAEATLNKLENELPAVYDTDKVEEQKMCECYNIRNEVRL